MPSKSIATASKRKRPTFSPPRPKNSKTKVGIVANKSLSNDVKRGATKSKQRKPVRLTSPTPSNLDSTADSELQSEPHSPPLDSEPDYMLAEVTHTEAAEDHEPAIPLPLIHTLLNHHFSDKDKTRISQEAKAVIGKYFDTFVREAIARSAFERKEQSAEDAAAELNGRGDDGWLEVEDLEKMAPQLVLDF